MAQAHALFFETLTTGEVCYLMERFIPLLTISFLSTSLMMMALWLYAKKIDNFSLVDAAWSFGFTVHALIFAVFSAGYGPRRLLVFVMLTAWSLRLFNFLARRIARHHPQEDARYLELRNKYEPNVHRGFFWFYQYQAWSISLLTFPTLFVCMNTNPELKGLEIAGFILWLVALAGESLADKQKADFYRDPARRRSVCKTGLWRYSRHPNYFFESLIWWGHFVFALGTPNMFMAIYAPLVMLFLLLRVTGIPISERAQLSRYGAEFKEYQRTTSSFIPRLPKS